ncbi:MAG: toast rack family protein [Chloroflexi bacterium]|nr:toast rack family protein [Chloroflexota bacterium]
MKPQLYAVIAVLLLASLACSININIPNIQTGPTQILTVNEPLPSGNEVTSVNIGMGAGTFKLSGGASVLVDGTIKYNVDSWKPTIERSGNSLSIQQGNNSINGIPTKNIVNDWDLKLNNTVPMDLDISAGAYKGTLDLSGLHLRNLAISDGASESEVTFSTPNPEQMDRLTYKTGASKVDLTGLGYANFSQMTFDGGAGSYTLDFSGKLSRDAAVTIRAGVSSLTVLIPAGMNARITNSGGLSNINAQGTWTVTDNVYSTSGSGPTLNVTIEMGVGSLKLIAQ